MYEPRYRGVSVNKSLAPNPQTECTESSVSVTLGMAAPLAGD